MRLLLIYIFTVSIFVSFGQSDNKNYIKIVAPTVPVDSILEGALIINEPETLDFDHRHESIRLEPGYSTAGHSGEIRPALFPTTIQYFDAFGRLEQEVAVKASPTGENIVTAMEYKGHMDKISKKTQPFVTSSVNYVDNYTSSLNNLYSGSVPGVAQDLSPVSEFEYENSALKRAIESSSPGDSWKMGNGHTATAEYDIVEIDYYKVDDNNTVSIVREKVHVTKTTNENDQVAEQYTNRRGETVKTEQEGLATRYVYDVYGNLRYVLQPEANEQHPISSTVLFTDNADIVNKYCFVYEYDNYNKLVLKKIPGQEPVKYYYDNFSRLMLSQDGNQRPNNECTFYKYDKYNRVIMTGKYTFNPDACPFTFQQYLSLVTTTLYASEERSLANYSVCKGYTSRCYPSVRNEVSEYTTEIQTVNYYDDYDFDSDGDVFEEDIFYERPDDINTWAYGSLSGFENNEVCYRVKGMLTGTMTKVLGEEEWINSVNFYDKYGKVIQVQSNNCVNGFDIISTAYSFDGRIEKTGRINTGTTAGYETAVIMKDRYEYDHVGRLEKVYKKTFDSWSNEGNTEEVLTTELKYNKIGQLTEKNLHVVNGSPLQSVDYTYNERGWLKSINNANINNSTDGDLFGMELLYDNYIADLGQTTHNKQYNGNIAAIKWSGANNQDVFSGTRAYAYSYDNHNRITAANYGEAATTSFSSMSKYMMSASYFANGNIRTLFRNDENGNAMDDLTYTYTGNQLQAVDEAMGSDFSRGFKDLVESVAFYSNGTAYAIADEYQYDANGNMTRDINKGISSIVYNQLNLPETITFTNGRSLIYTYTARGEKIREEDSGEGGFPMVYGGEMRAFCNGIVYSGNRDNFADTRTIEYIMHSEGKINSLNGGDEFQYTYFIKDHLGNNRVEFTYDADGSVVQLEETHYYPFGLTMPGMSLVGPDANEYKYNGKQYIGRAGLNWYDYGARFYDPALGRWHSIDPMAEKYFAQSPYHFSGNNPVLFIDANGMDYGSDQFFQIGIQRLLSGFGSGKSVINSSMKRLKEQTQEEWQDQQDHFDMIDNGSAGAQNATNNQETVEAKSDDKTQNKEGMPVGKNVPGGKWDDWGEGSVPYQGKAIGSTNFIGPGPDANPFSLGMQPIDEIDQAAQWHDYAYWKAGTGGVKGALSNTNVRFADVELVYSAVSIMERYASGGIDNVTGMPISQRTFNLASAVYVAFMPIVQNKFRNEGVIYPIIVPER